MTALLAITLGFLSHSNMPNEIPLMAVGFGLRYSPDTPVPVSPDHPLYNRVLIDPIEEMPGSVRLSIARPSTINEGLKLTLEHLHMLAPTSAEAKVRLTARWVSYDGGGMLFGGKNATVTLHYRLTRIDSGAVIFDREIITKAMADNKAGGPMPTLRAATAVNFASIAGCLDKAAFGRAPSDCALTPQFHVTTRRR
ncbi:hypothetical protein [Sphingobium sp. LMA1-1-1.1]|uniref:hypothetical protein n=1 Tax=Sphingobium sp. LMA1-1-1.1 TaxID=3135238 RepID=UPI00342BCF60